MKKIFLFLTAATLLMVGCNKSELRVNLPGGNNDEMVLRPLANKMTKAGELTGISLPNTYGIYAAATQRNSAGIIENASFFDDPYEQLFGTTEPDPAGIGTAAAEADTRKWHAGSYDGAFSVVPMYWPFGGVKMDFLAYAIPMASHQDTGLSTGVWSATWDAPTTDAASQFTFNDVNTYANQVDVMYAAANSQTNAENGGLANSTPMSFKHAQALLIFNVKVNPEATGKLTINDIEFISDARIAALRTAGYTGVDAAAQVDADVTLKTVGDFQVNNERNDLIAGWSGMSAVAAQYRMPVAAIAAPSNANSVVLAQEHGDDLIQQYGEAIPFNGYDDDTNPETPDVAAGYAQLGETLMIPQQEKVNFVIKYTLNGKTMYYKYNDLRGSWEMGKKYIYNLDLTMNEIVISENVVNWVESAQDVVLN